MSWDYTHDVPFETFDYSTMLYCLNIMQSVNGHDFTQDQKVGVMMALFSGDNKPARHDYVSATMTLAAGLNDIPDFDLFDASIFLALIFGRTKERTLDDLFEARGPLVKETVAAGGECYKGPCEDCYDCDAC